MFKPLLRTLPSLSGNFTIACKLNEISQDERDEYSTYIRTATLLPLQNSLYTDGIDVNLLNGKYEHDIKKYFYKYSNYFYKENYTYNKKNYKVLDINSKFDNLSDSRNKDYEFGCKRISYQQNKYAYSFYAPIYIDDINDLPEYFVINLQFNEVHTKSIKIYLNKENKVNYLYKYIKLYLSKIDNRVIFCLPDSLQATYFGIDIKNGGLTQYKDNIIGYIYKNQTTINNFDKTICNGFERNGLIMRQIIPLSFMFNINDIFTEYEKQFFAGYKIKITGYYCTKNNIKYDFFDFDTNYWSSYNKYLKYNERSGEYKLTYGLNNGDSINIMDIGYPSLNEAKYIKYINFNKVTPNVCKFKMMLSDDKDPYITNLSFAYSYLQNPNQKYGYFPTMYKDIHPNAIVNNNDLILPLGDNIDKYYKTSKYFANKVYSNSTNYDKYIKLMSNYYGSWFNICDLTDFKNIDDVIQYKEFSDVEYNYAYFKGILYNLYELQNLNINKFGVFMSFDINYIDNQTYKDNYIKAKYVLSKSNESSIKINDYNDNYDTGVFSTILDYKYYQKLVNQLNYNKNAYLLPNKVLKHDLKGKYIVDNDFNNENTYYKYDDILNTLKSFSELSNIISDIEKELSISKLTGYLLQNAYNRNNLFIEKYNLNGKTLSLLLSDELFNTNSYNNKYDWLKNNLYISTELNTSKILLSTYYSNIKDNENIGENILLYLKDTYIHIQDIIVMFEYYVDKNYIDNVLFISIMKNISKLNKYINKLYGNINGIDIDNYFVNNSYNISKSPLYIDTYNLNYLIKEYNSHYNNNIENILSSYKYEFYIKFLDLDHIKEYYSRLNKDENKKSTLLSYKNILSQIYVKCRHWIINNRSFDIFDSYVDVLTYIKNIHNYIEFDNYNNLEKYVNKYINILNIYDNNQIFDMFIDSLSDTRCNNECFVLDIGNGYKILLDLYFKKEVYKLNDNICKIFKNTNNYPYLYILDNNLISYSYWDVLDSNTGLYNINESLVPLFNNVYNNENDKSIISEILNNANNYEYQYESDIYCKEINILESVKTLLKTKSNYYIQNNIKSLLKDSKINASWNEYIINDNDYNEKQFVDEFIYFLYNNYEDIFYHIANQLNIKLYSIINELSLNSNPIESSNMIYNEKYNIYMFEHNGYKYGVYIISCLIDNTSNSFYIKNNTTNDKIFNSINGKSISNVDNKYFNDIYYLLLPFMKINIFSEYAKIVNTITYPYESEIVINYYTRALNKNDEYKYNILKKSEYDTLYSDLYELGDKKKLKLLRYFNYITPYLYKTNIIKDNYQLKFINKNDIYEYIEKYNIYDRKNININRYDPITLYYGKFNNNEYDSKKNVYQLEYKHFNDNIVYNLPESISFKEDTIYSYNELNNLLNSDSFNDKKIKILYKYFRRNNLDYKDIMLFLFNKYESSHEIIKVYDSNILEQCKFNISYKFNLI